jgi:GNAT superfamily N-acetyltransferase
VNELERVEAHALRDALLLGGGRAATAGGAMCLAHPGTPVRVVNRALPLDAVVDVGAIAAWYRGHPHQIALAPGYLGLEQMLDAAGYEREDAIAKHQRGASPAAPAPTDLRVERTRDAGAFAHAAASGYGVPLAFFEELSALVGAPGFHVFLAWAGDVPAACGVLFADGPEAWLGLGATRAEFRGRGAQSALIAARIECARELGVRRIAVETAVEGPSRRNVERAGFSLAYLREHRRSARRG